MALNNQQSQETVTRRRGDGASAPFILRSLLRTLSALLLMTQTPSLASGQAEDPLAVYRTWNIPPWALEALGRDFSVTNDWYDRMNPFYQRADFDGDGQTDIALLIREKSTGKVGIAFRAPGTRYGPYRWSR